MSDSFVTGVASIINKLNGLPFDDTDEQLFEVSWDYQKTIDTNGRILYLITFFVDDNSEYFVTSMWVWGHDLKIGVRKANYHTALSILT